MFLGLHDPSLHNCEGTLCAAVAQVRYCLEASKQSIAPSALQEFRSLQVAAIKRLACAGAISHVVDACPHTHTICFFLHVHTAGLYPFIEYGSGPCKKDMTHKSWNLNLCEQVWCSSLAEMSVQTANHPPSSPSAAPMLASMLAALAGMPPGMLPNCDTHQGRHRHTHDRQSPNHLPSPGFTHQIDIELARRIC